MDYYPELLYLFMYMCIGLTAIVYASIILALVIWIRRKIHDTSNDNSSNTICDSDNNSSDI